METKISRDLSRLKQDGTASGREVREFIGRMRGKSPQEVLGMIAQSNLVSGVTVATVATVVLMAVFTIGPYFLRDRTRVAKPAPTSAESKPAQAATPATEPAQSATPAEKPKEQPAPDKTILEKLDMDEVKETDPDANPLEEKSDDLLKGLR